MAQPPFLCFAKRFSVGQFLLHLSADMVLAGVCPMDVLEFRKCCHIVAGLRFAWCMPVQPQHPVMLLQIFTVFLLDAYSVRACCRSSLCSW